MFVELISYHKNMTWRRGGCWRVDGTTDNTHTKQRTEQEASVIRYFNANMEPQEAFTVFYSANMTLDVILRFGLLISRCQSHRKVWGCIPYLATLKIRVSYFVQWWNSEGGVGKCYSGWTVHSLKFCFYIQTKNVTVDWLYIFVMSLILASYTTRPISKVKLVNSYLRAWMGHARLEKLVIVSCERDITNKFCLDKLTSQNYQWHQIVFSPWPTTSSWSHYSSWFQ